MTDDEAATAVAGALRMGYRLVDTAAKYGNEVGVGRGIAASGVPRAEVLVTSKVRGADQGYEETLRACEQTRRDLGLEYLDLYLIHWPLPRVDKYVDTWRALDAGAGRRAGALDRGLELHRRPGSTGSSPRPG